MKSIATQTATAIALAALALTAPISQDGPLFSSIAWADEDGDGEGGGPENSQGNQGGQGQGEQGAQSGQDNQGGAGDGQGGPDDSSDSKGPQAGGPSDSGSGGGKPVWAQEGIPEVELGRLSVARAPQQVLDRALAEALATQSTSITDFYNLSFDAILDQFYNNWDNITIYDSPLQNLALFQDVLADGDVQLTGVADSSSADEEKLLAVFLGVASDKTVTVSEDTVSAMITILGDDLGSTIDVDVEDLAAMAEAVRFAVYVGHEG